MLEINKRYEAKIIDLDYKGDGIARINDSFIYVPKALKDEIVILEIIKIKKNVGFAKLIEVKEKSIDRTSFKTELGSISLAHLKFNKQLEWQSEITKKTLEKVLKEKIKINEIITDFNEFKYRNKVVYHVFKNEDLKIGLYKENSKDLIIEEDFVLTTDFVNKVISDINNANIKVDYSIFKNIIFRNNTKNEYLVTLVSYKKRFKGFNELVELLKGYKNIIGITVNIKETNESILGSKSFVVYGNEYLKHKNLLISDTSFMQINYGVMDQILSKIKEYVIGKKVIDAYSGIGSIGFSILDNKYDITMIDNNSENIRLAKIIKEENKNENIDILLGNAEEIISNQFADTIIVDPPRSGLDKLMINGIIENKIKRVIYLSCDLQSLTRDLKEFVNSYKILDVYPVKMFPQTNSFETLVVLDLK